MASSKSNQSRFLGDFPMQGDISEKEKSSRYAKAYATVWLSKNIVTMIKNDQFKKGNVLNVARIAGILGAKQTSSLIPLCHNSELY